MLRIGLCFSLISIWCDQVQQFHTVSYNQFMLAFQWFHKPIRAMLILRMHIINIINLMLLLLWKISKILTWLAKWQKKVQEECTKSPMSGILASFCERMKALWRSTFQFKVVGTCQVSKSQWTKTYKHSFEHYWLLFFISFI